MIDSTTYPLKFNSSKRNLSSIVGILLDRTVGTLEFVATAELVEGVPWDHVAAHQSHGWVVFGALLPKDGTGEHRVVPVLLAKVNFNWQLILPTPDASHLSLLHNLATKIMFLLTK